MCVRRKDPVKSPQEGGHPQAKERGHREPRTAGTLTWDFSLQSSEKINSVV